MRERRSCASAPFHSCAARGSALHCRSAAASLLPPACMVDVSDDNIRVQHSNRQCHDRRCTPAHETSWSSSSIFLQHCAGAVSKKQHRCSGREAVQRPGGEGPVLRGGGVRGKVQQALQPGAQLQRALQRRVPRQHRHRPAAILSVRLPVFSPGAVDIYPTKPTFIGDHLPVGSLLCRAQQLMEDDQKSGKSSQT